MKTYPKICINCQTPFVSASPTARFCKRECVTEFYKKMRPIPVKKVYKIDKELKEEWDATESTRTKCYLCGQEFNWNFEYANKNGRRCPECVKKSRWS